AAASGASPARAGTWISPSSPSVQVTRVTRAPSAAYLAMVAPEPIDSSSGWAWTNTILRVTVAFPLLAAGLFARGLQPYATPSPEYATGVRRSGTIVGWTTRNSPSVPADSGTPRPAR